MLSLLDLEGGKKKEKAVGVESEGAGIEKSEGAGNGGRVSRSGGGGGGGQVVEVVEVGFGHGGGVSPGLLHFTQDLVDGATWPRNLAFSLGTHARGALDGLQLLQLSAMSARCAFALQSKAADAVPGAKQGPSAGLVSRGGGLVRALLTKPLEFQYAPAAPPFCCTCCQGSVDRALTEP